MPVERWVSALRIRMRSLFRRTAAERELDEELQFHIDQATAEFEARGLPRATARRAALLSLGGLDLRKEQCRDARGLRLPSALGRDISLALRLLRRQTVFGATVVLTLAAGIGTLISAITVQNWLLYRPLPGVSDASTLIAIRLGTADLSGATPMSLDDVDRLARGAPGLRGLTGVEDMPVQVSVSSADQSPRRVAATFVMANFFDVLGVTVAGRAFTADEEQLPGASPVAVFSERIAQAFGGDAIVGRTILVNGQSTLVAGIARTGFRGTARLSPVDVWMPLAQRGMGLPPGGDAPARLGLRAPLMWMLVGRADPGASVVHLQEQVTRAEQDIVGALPPDNRRFASHHLRVVETLERFPAQRELLERVFRLLVVAAALLLILACANAGNAMLARSVARTGEFATRLTLGATRWGLARSLLVEGIALAVMAGAIGIGAAALLARSLDGVTILATVPAIEQPRLDRFVMSLSIAISLVVAAGSSLAAMWAVRHTGLIAPMQRSSRSVSFGRHRVTQSLMVAQVAISVTLLIGAALFVRSVRAQLGVDVGFDRMRVLTFRLEPRRLPGDPSLAFRQELIDRLRAVPGVRAASVAFLPPFYSGMEARIGLRADGTPDDAESVTLMLNAVHPGFFDAVGIALVAGRDFSESDLRLPQAQAPLILPESVARRVFGSTDVVGRFVLTQTTRRQVVGVVRDSRQRRVVSDDTMDLAFQPHRADYRTPFITGVLRVDSSSLDVWPDARRAVAAVDSSLVMFEAKSVDEGIRTEVGTELLTMRLAVVLGGIAVFLAAVGLAAVLSRGLAERRRELGIRAALGATPARLVVLVGRQSATVLLAGVILGAGATMWLTRYIESRLYGVSALDATSFVGAIAIVTSVMIAATLPTCRRAAGTDPAKTLREG